MAENSETQANGHQPEENVLAVNADEQSGTVDPDTMDVSIQFIGATSISKKDFNGLSDPYFIASIDDKIEYTSAIQTQTLNPVWNVTWNVSCVPKSARLKVVVMDRDEDSSSDDTVGSFDVELTSGKKDCKIIGGMLKTRSGTFTLNITATEPTTPSKFKYNFTGPAHCTIHHPPLLPNQVAPRNPGMNDLCTIHLAHTQTHLGSHLQPWSRKSKSAKFIFKGLTSVTTRAGIRAAWQHLFDHRASDDVVDLANADEFLRMFKVNGGVIEPAIYTYVISSASATSSIAVLRFCETGCTWLTDFPSTHALLADASTTVLYAGEFHFRPSCGWENLQAAASNPDEVQWELVIDNTSPTYAPHPALLPSISSLLSANFPALSIITLEHSDPALHLSKSSLQSYAIQHRGVLTQELQPYVPDGKQTLMKYAMSLKSVKASGGINEDSVFKAVKGGVEIAEAVHELYEAVNH